MSHMRHNNIRQKSITFEGERVNAQVRRVINGHCRLDLNDTINKKFMVNGWETLRLDFAELQHQTPARI